MASTFGYFESAKSGLSVAMQQLHVTEQNIANVNTEGYTRQRLLTSAKEPPISAYLIAQLNKAAVGQGVEATGIQQLRSEYFDQQYRSLNSGLNDYTNRDEALTYLTGLFNELNDSSSLTTSIKNFFSALSKFSEDTSSKEYRTNVQQQALSMTQNFNNVYEEMQSLWHEQNDSIGTVAQKINAAAQKIAQLNEAIARAVQTGGVANDLNDERNLLLDQLSGYVDITYSVNTNNISMIDVQIGGLSLVQGKTASEIEMSSAVSQTGQINSLLSEIVAVNQDASLSTYADKAAAINNIITRTAPTPGLASYLPADMIQLQPNATSSGLVDVMFGSAVIVAGTDTTPTPVEQSVSSDLDAWVAFNRNNLTLNDEELSIEEGNVKSGQLFSNMNMITSKGALNPGIPYYMDQLNTFVREMAANINAINESGYTYPDPDNPSSFSQQNVSFFNDPQTAGNFTLSDALLESVYNIAGSSVAVDLDDDPTNTGNNIIALRLSKDLVNSGYYDKLNSLVVNLGIAANTSESIMSTKQSLLSSVDTQRHSLSSVSLDEEATNLIVFQQSYNAAARIITTLDEMLNTMINNMGIVGR